MSLFVIESPDTLPMITNIPYLVESRDNKSGEAHASENIRPLGASVLQAVRSHDRGALLSALVADHLLQPDSVLAADADS